MEARKVNAEEINEAGWKWGGAEFENGIEQLRIQLENEGIGPVSDATGVHIEISCAALTQSFQIIECNAVRLFRGATLRNPTKRLILITLTGSPSFVPGPHLEKGSLYDLSEEGQQILSLCADIIFIRVAKDEEIES